AGQNGSITQEGIIALLSGPPQSDSAEERERQRVAQRIRGVYESQRLVSLDTLFELGDGLAQQDSPNKPATDSLVRLAGALREFEMPQPMFTNRERSEWASGLQFNPHTSLQTRTDLSKVIAGSKGPELKDARGLLAPFLRDAIVGLNYAFYE